MKTTATCAILAQTLFIIKKRNMKTFIVLALDTRRAKTDGTYPILLRIIHHGKPSAITTGIYIKEKDWDSKARCIKSSYKGTESVARLNNQLQKKKTEATDIVMKLEEKKTLNGLTVVELKELIEKKPQELSFFTYAETIIAELKKANKIGNARTYQCSLDALKNYRAQRDLSFYELTRSLLEKFETENLAKGNSVNGISVYLRTIRAIYNRAIKAGIVDQESYPFRNFEIKSEKTRKRAISHSAIQRIEKFEPVLGDSLFNCRNYFLISFYLRGISFTDLARLTMGSIADGRINYSRQKEHNPYSIKITPAIQKILDWYIKGKRKEDFIFPIMSKGTPAQQYKRVEWARKRFNKKLKKLAEKCEIDENLTSYVSRHSFASRAKNMGIDVASISELMGHQDLQTTQIYLDSLPSDLLDEIHEKIIQ
jgi:site-specific recombinase XerD